jgi:hypothetical protein
MQAGQFFDDVRLTGDIRTVRRRHYRKRPAARSLIGFHPEGAEQLCRSFALDRQTEQFLDALFAQQYGPLLRFAGKAVRNSGLDTRAGELAQ